MSHKVHFLTPKPVMLLSKDKETLFGFLSQLSEDLGGEGRELYSKEGDLRVGTRLRQVGECGTSAFHAWRMVTGSTNHNKTRKPKLAEGTGSIPPCILAQQDSWPAELRDSKHIVLNWKSPWLFVLIGTRNQHSIPWESEVISALHGSFQVFSLPFPSAHRLQVTVWACSTQALFSCSGPSKTGGQWDLWTHLAHTTYCSPKQDLIFHDLLLQLGDSDLPEAGRECIYRAPVLSTRLSGCRSHEIAPSTSRMIIQ